MTREHPLSRESKDGKYITIYIYQGDQWLVHLGHEKTGKPAGTVSWEKAIEMGLFYPDEKPELLVSCHE
ncbi:MAG TPA: hypothetical protein VMW24_24745 [Sedimentisphaerales bacterium]|nr:hypothetical protein [Sedimentisphaerales bacterium]